ncbi:MAG TPA: cupin domain-containing protein [Terriglobia bacterium]|nr:cupin domain-containing protein [Terriglobia bacterium]
MNGSRRDWLTQLPVLAAIASARAGAQPPASLRSKAYPFEDLTASSHGGNATRPVLEGETHSGAFIELHETDLGPGGMPHPPHHHVHEEMFLVREGALEVTISAVTSRLGPGGVAFVASNQEHGVRNPGPGHAQYFVLAVGKDQ